MCYRPSKDFDLAPALLKDTRIYSEMFRGSEILKMFWCSTMLKDVQMLRDAWSIVADALIKLIGIQRCMEILKDDLRYSEMHGDSERSLEMLIGPYSCLEMFIDTWRHSKTLGDAQRHLKKIKDTYRCSKIRIYF